MQRADIAALKRSHPIEAVVAGYGIALRPVGQTLVGRCPFHEDRGRPNLVVYPATRSWYCYRCGVGGDVIQFVERIEGLSFQDAVQKLADIRIVGRTSALRPPTQPQSSCPSEPAILTAAVETYNACLLAEPSAQAYLQERGINQATIERYRLGYASGDELVPYLRRRRLSLAAARRAGLLRHGHEFLAGRIVIPEFRAGQPVWLIGRALHCPADAPRYLSLPGAKPLLGWVEASHSRDVYLVEGAFDWLTLRQWDLPALALMGTHASADALEALTRFDRVYLALDNDAAGCKATQALTLALDGRAVPVQLEGVKDVAELAPQPGGRDRFLEMVRASTGAKTAHVRTIREQGDVTMAYSVNRVELVGRLGRDVELRYTPEGHAVANFSLATDRPPKANGEAVTDWHRIVCWGQLAEFCGEYLAKDRLVFVAGRLTYRTWEGKDGQKRYTTEIIASEVVALDRRPETVPVEPVSEEPSF